MVCVQEHLVLGRTELTDIFACANEKANMQSGSNLRWKVLHDEVAQDNDHGRTLIHFVALLTTI
jgi:hypothetical protein